MSDTQEMVRTTDVLQKVADLLPNFRQRAQQAEDERQVPKSSIDELREAGFFKMLQPARYGGMQADPVDFYTAVKMISSACGHRPSAPCCRSAGCSTCAPWSIPSPTNGSRSPRSRQPS